MFDDPKPTAPSQAAPKPPSPPAPPRPVSVAPTPASGAGIDDMFASVKDAPVVAPTTPAMPRVMAMPTPAAAMMPATNAGSGSGMAVKIVLIILLIGALAGGTIYYMNARSKQASANLPPVAPTPEMLANQQATGQMTETPKASEPPVSTPAPAQEQAPAPAPAPVAAPRDTDCDGLTDDQEKQFGTDPTTKDTDGDGLTDYEEVIMNGTNPLSKDSDADTLTDYDEVKVFRTDTKKADTDGDTYPDATEVANGYSPTGAGKMSAEILAARDAWLADKAAGKKADSGYMAKSSDPACLVNPSAAPAPTPKPMVP